MTRFMCGTRRTRLHHCRPGFTIIELLVVLAIIGIIIAISVPAIQSARESSRRLSCRSHLRQIGVATQTFLTTKGHFPPSNDRYFSYLVALLPLMDQTALHDQLREAGKDGWTPQAIPHMQRLEEKTLISAYHCPSDPNPLTTNTNYLGNSGSGYEADDGAITGVPARPAQFIDGLSNTALVSEFVCGMGHQPIMHLSVQVDHLNEWWNDFVPACETIPEQQEYPGQYMGLSWIEPGYPATVYSHVLTPGKNSCESKLSGTATMIATPRSHHRAGVNVLFADGHVDFVSYSVDQQVWRQFGSRKDQDSFWEK